MHVLNHSHHSQYRCGIDSLAQSLVVEADVAACDRNFQFLARPSDSINRLRKLPHDMRLFRTAEVEAISRTDRSRARASHLARCFSHGMHRPKAGVQIAPASISVESHGQSAL